VTGANAQCAKAKGKGKRVRPAGKDPGSASRCEQAVFVGSFYIYNWLGLAALTSWDLEEKKTAEFL
jgi:hypothetical protein